MSARNAAMVAVLLLCSGIASADIDYNVTIKPSADASPTRMAISIKIPVRSAMTSLQMPNWGPGSYGYGDFWKNVADFKATGGDKELTFAKPNDYTWTIPTNGVRSLVVSYTVPITITEEIAHYGGPRNYMYVVDRKTEKCNLAIDVPADWNIATGLDGSKGHYSAPNYDVLADNPVTAGKYRELQYTVGGKPHFIVLYGPARNDLDTDSLIKSSTFIAAAENDFFGNKPPYSHFVWHFNVGKRPDGGGGLEHLASTEITLANGLGPGIIGVNAHEFFHVWNVKRIRSRALGPFDYTKLPETGALWWLEGVTEYYAHQLMTRYGYWDDKKWYATVVSNVQKVRNNPAHLEVGPYESSFRVKDANNGRGNSSGYKISYYDLGVVAGVCLDIELLAQTNGKHSLDDVTHALWDICKDNQPGFDEDEIRQQCVRFGGLPLGEMYDNIIMRAGEMPVEGQLAKVGLKLATVNKELPDLGVVMTTSIAGGGMTVQKVTSVAEGKLKVDDIVLQVNGSAVPTNGALAAVVGKIKGGDVVTFQVKRGDQTMDVTVTAGTTTRATMEIQEDPNATDAQKALREIWLYRGKKDWQVKG
jgi:predicted metalloprotease with PDZ domain